MPRYYTPPRANYHALRVRIPDELANFLKLHAKKLDVSMNAVIIAALELIMRNEEQKKGKDK